MTEENKLLVIYVGVQGVRMEDIEHFVKSITTRKIHYGCRVNYCTYRNDEKIKRRTPTSIGAIKTRK